MRMNIQLSSIDLISVDIIAIDITHINKSTLGFSITYKIMKGY